MSFLLIIQAIFRSRFHTPIAAGDRRADGAALNKRIGRRRLGRG
jgi:hypothetical protein